MIKCTVLNKMSNLSEVEGIVGCGRIKLITFLITLCLILYHLLLLVNYGGDSCEWLLNNGRLQGYSDWQPYGCMMHNYSNSDARECMKYVKFWSTSSSFSSSSRKPAAADLRKFSASYFVFVGDLRVRRLFVELVRTIHSPQQGQGQGTEEWSWMRSDVRVLEGESGRDLKYQDEGIGLTVVCTLNSFNPNYALEHRTHSRFLWRPVIDKSMIEMYKEWISSEHQRPTVIIADSSTWSSEKFNAGEIKALHKFKDKLRKLLPLMTQLNETTQVLWLLQDPLLETVASDQLINNRVIDLYNLALVNAVSETRSENIHVWSSARLVSNVFISTVQHKHHVTATDNYESDVATGRIGGASDKIGGANDKIDAANDRIDAASHGMGGANDRINGANDKIDAASHPLGGANDKIGEASNPVEGASDALKENNNNNIGKAAGDKLVRNNDREEASDRENAGDDKGRIVNIVEGSSKKTVEETLTKVEQDRKSNVVDDSLSKIENKVKVSNSIIDDINAPSRVLNSDNDGHQDTLIKNSKPVDTVKHDDILQSDDVKGAAGSQVKDGRETYGSKMPPISRKLQSLEPQGDSEKMRSGLDADNGDQLLDKKPASKQTSRNVSKPSDDPERIGDGLQFENVNTKVDEKADSHALEKEEPALIDRSLQVNVQLLLNLYCNDRMNHKDCSCCVRPETVSRAQMIMLAFAGVSCLIALIALIWMILSALFNLGGFSVNTFLHPDELETNNTPKFAKNLTSQPDCRDDLSFCGLDQLKSADEIELEVSSGETVTCREWMKVLFLIARFSAILIFFFLCDRTRVLMNENKHYSHVGFLLPLLYLLVLGLFFTEKSQQTEILDRNQTDEWKGWMLLVILLCNITGSISHLSIKPFINVLVSSYLFLSGYGHVSYFIRTGDTSIHRFLTVMLRMNMLAVCLCVILSSHYLLYELISLLSLWFSLIFLIFSLPPRLSPASSMSSCGSTPCFTGYSLVMTVIKLCTVWALTAVLCKHELLFERVFSILSPMFISTDGSFSDWRQLTLLHPYSALTGASLAIAIPIAKSFTYFNELTQHKIFKSDFFSYFTALVSGGALLLIGLKELVKSTQVILFNSNEAQSFKTHSTYTAVLWNGTGSETEFGYLSTVLIPVFLYISVRNSIPALRSHYSSFFSWHGKFSLELYVCQYHIWQSRDGAGVLVLLPDSPYLNLVLSTLIFISLSHELHHISRSLTPYLPPSTARIIAYSIGCIAALSLLGYLLL